ncbi:MAG: NAD(P)H-dependent oxidoreductase subunit E [Planctomycetota bacterium]|nr:NAD(P)H-dependent oxidoreductase subunit E [Planctomycetota bacterium]
MALPEKLVDEFNALVKNYPAGKEGKRSGLIPALHRCQEELGGWVTPEIMEDLAAFFDLEPAEVYGVASFYPMFRLTPPGKHVIKVCHNISCDLVGARDVLAKAKELTGAEVHGTSPDGKFTLEVVECQGCCSTAPMIDLDNTFHENLTLDELERLIGECQ